MICFSPLHLGSIYGQKNIEARKNLRLCSRMKNANWIGYITSKFHICRLLEESTLFG